MRETVWERERKNEIKKFMNIFGCIERERERERESRKKQCERQRGRWSNSYEKIKREK